MTQWKRTRPFTIILLLIILAAGGCRQTSAPDQTAETPAPLLPTAPAHEDALAPAPTAVPTSTAAPTAPVTAVPTLPATTGAPPPTEPAVPEAAPEDSDYRVSYVAADDTLNVRAGPGVTNEVVGQLPPDAANVTITGAGQQVAGATWAPISANGVTGWVNTRFLTADIPEAEFCDSAEVAQLLADFETAVALRDGAALAKLVHPERGLRLRRHWWNPEVRIAGAELTQLFSSQTSYTWGIADGTGDPITGSFEAVMYPLLQQNLLEATESGCNEILSGGSAGMIILPDGYQQQNFYSFYRPGSAEFGGLDWGSWVVGVEQWQGAYYISFLVHFEWEI